ncbi:unnamed protein product, partial [Meganyctiphanes norvegica]
AVICTRPPPGPRFFKDNVHLTFAKVTCEGQFEKIAGRCLYISKWGEEKTWFGANIHCRNLGSQLIIDPSWEVASHIRGNKDDCNKADGGKCGFGTWVAGFYEPYESYQWITSTNSSGKNI